MDEATVREHAEKHGEATVAGDMKRAGSDLDPSAFGAAGEVMKQMPAELSSSEVVSVEQQGSEWMVRIRYSGPEASATVESTWAERDGRPKIVGLKVV